LLHKNALNLALETSASAVYQQPESLLDRLKLYRSRLTLLLLSLITFLVVLSIAQKKKRSVLIGAISATGCVVLLL
jgi:hypothetical protein